MARRWFSGRRIRGLSSDSKPTLVEDNQEFTETDTGKVFDWSGSVWSQRKSIQSISTTSATLNFASDELQTIQITGTTTFTTTNRSVGRSKTVRIYNANGSVVTLNFPSGWKFVGSKPTDIEGYKRAILTMTCFGSADTDIIAAYAVEE